MNTGLEDVVAAHTVLSDVDGKNGRLIVRGISLADLVAGSRYEDVLALLFAGFFPLPADLPTALGAARLAVFDHIDLTDTALLTLPRSTLCAFCSPACPTVTTCMPP